MAGHMRDRVRARLEAAKRRLGVTGDANPFDLRSKPSRSTPVGGQSGRSRLRPESKLVNGNGESGVSSGLLDQRATLQPRKEGYPHPRTDAAREMPDGTPRAFTSRDAYAEVRMRSKQHRLEEQRQSRDVRDRIDALDAKTAELRLQSRLPQAERRREPPIAVDFQPISGQAVPAHRGSATVADAIRVGAERLRELDRGAPSRRRQQQRAEADRREAGDDAENLYGNLEFSADSSESSTGDSSASTADPSDPSYRPEVQCTALSRLTFVLDVPDEQEAFMALLDDVASTDEILVLDRLIKSNSTLLTQGNKPAMDRLAGFCVRRFETLLFVREDLDLARLDSLARALRHITTEVPRTLGAHYQGLILRLHGNLRRVNYLATEGCGAALPTLQALEAAIPFDSAGPNTFYELWGRHLFGAVVVGRLLAVVFPQGSFYGADPALGLPLFREQPLISAFFLAIDTALQSLVLRVRAGCGAPTVELVRDTLCLQALLSVAASLASAVQLFFPTIVTGLQAALEGFDALLVAAVPAPLLTDAAVRFRALPVAAEHRLDIADVFVGSPTLTLGGLLGGLASTLNVALLTRLFVDPLALGGVRAALPAWLSGGADEPFTLGWCAHQLRDEAIASAAAASAPSWARERAREIETHAPLFRQDFAPGKTMDPSAARERERRLQKREKRQARDELRSAQRVSRARTAARLAQDAALRQARRAALGGVRRSLESDQHGYKELDRLGRKLKRR
ncbi:Nop14-like family protein [Giardia muris]|uniref:Nop14-like family protein n=1 Tax=Giardia muris TaxID=5742 RepID=A0A4Z1SL46_GIAMU|nr:Nop14-like family protein [Giardia muris]|eukprot:TNJ26364.1 Nop14-like family protein [Giardia muris]